VAACLPVAAFYCLPAGTYFPLVAYLAPFAGVVAAGVPPPIACFAFSFSASFAALMLAITSSKDSPASRPVATASLTLNTIFEGSALGLRTIPGGKVLARSPMV